MLLMLRLWGCLCIKCINLKSLLHLLHENLLILLWRFLCWTVLFLLLKILSYTSHVHSPVLFYCNNYTKVSAMYGKLAPWRPIHSVHCSINPPPPHHKYYFLIFARPWHFCLTPIKSASCPNLTPLFRQFLPIYCFFMPPNKNPIF